MRYIGVDLHKTNFVACSLDEQERILVLVLEGSSYREHGDFHRGHEATSATLSGFGVSVDAVLDAAA